MLECRKPFFEGGKGEELILMEVWSQVNRYFRLAIW